MKTFKNVFSAITLIDPETGSQIRVYGRQSLRRRSANYRHARMALYCGTSGAESLHKIKSFEVTDRIRVLRDLFKRLNSL